MIKKIIIILLVFFILYLTLYLNKEKFQTISYYDEYMYPNTDFMGYTFDPVMMGPGVVRLDTTSVSTVDTSTNNVNNTQSTNTMVSFIDDGKSGIKTGGNMCGLSTQEYSCLSEDGCKWNKDKCEPNRTHKICGEIIDENECNNSNLKCIYDNSKNRCFKEINYFFDDKTNNNNNNNNNDVNYEYYDRDCESLRKRGHDVYCTYDKDSINDESLYFNLDRTIDLEKKRYKTCYDEDCMNTSTNKN